MDSDQIDHAAMDSDDSSQDGRSDGQYSQEGQQEPRHESAGRQPDADIADAADEAAPRTRALLDALLDEGGQMGGAADSADAQGEGSAAQDATGQVPDAAQATAAMSGAEREEEELLEGVKSERGRERIKAVFQRSKALEQDVNEIREMVQSTGMSPTEFAQTLEFGRLASSGDEKCLRVALQMVDEQRAQLLTRLGMDAPGFDPLAEQQDLAEAVENMEITRERAVELAQHRRRESQGQQQRLQQERSQQEQQQFHQQLQSVGQSMESFFLSRMKEIDHAPRWKAVETYFKNPENMQKFVQTYQPNQWMDVMQMMYEGVQVPRESAVRQPQPLRSRPTPLGAAAATGTTAIDRLASRLASAGI